MYEIRPATDDDAKGIHELLRARDDWARQRGLLSPDSIALRVLMGNAGSDMALMLLTEDKAVVGCGVLYATTPGWTWTASERAERSMSLAMMHTHPNQRGARLTGLMTLWVFDYAARCTSPVLQWVRCSVPDNRLACWFVSGGPVPVGPLRVRRHPAEAARGPRSPPGLLQLSDSKRGSPETLTI